VVDHGFGRRSLLLLALPAMVIPGVFALRTPAIRLVGPAD
jgi:hypothetical protein